MFNQICEHNDDTWCCGISLNQRPTSQPQGSSTLLSGFTVCSAYLRTWGVYVISGFFSNTRKPLVNDVWLPVVVDNDAVVWVHRVLRRHDAIPQSSSGGLGRDAQDPLFVVRFPPGVCFCLKWGGEGSDRRAEMAVVAGWTIQEIPARQELSWHSPAACSGK